MDKFSIEICKLLRKEKRQSEIYLGHFPFQWDFVVGYFAADCTEAMPLTLFDKTICGVLGLDGRMSITALGEILGFNVKDNPEDGEYRDKAEYSLLYKAVQALLDFNMIEHDIYDNIQLTDIGMEYYAKGKKFRTTTAKSFNVYFDMTSGQHGKARAIASQLTVRTVQSSLKEEYANEAFIKGFIHEQLPEIFDPEKGNSFTNTTCNRICDLISVNVEIGVLYDVVAKHVRYIPVVEEEINSDLKSIIGSNDAILGSLNEVFLASIVQDNAPIADGIQQDSFEATIMDSPKRIDEKEDISAHIPSVMEPEEFWQSLPLLFSESEKNVFFRAQRMGEAEMLGVSTLAAQHQGTNVFLSCPDCDEYPDSKQNLFFMEKEIGGDYLCCTEKVTYALRSYSFRIGDITAQTSMVFRYTEDKNTDEIRIEYAKDLLPSIYKDAMAFLDTDFDMTKRSVRSISHCDDRVMVFEDFLQDNLLEQLRKKKQDAFNDVKLGYEKVLIKRVTDFINGCDLEEISMVKAIDEIDDKLNNLISDADETYVTLMEIVRSFRTELRARELRIREEVLPSKVYIIDTNVFLDDPDILSRIKRPDRVVLAAGVINELDRMKLKNTDPEKAANARKAVRGIKDLLQKDKKGKRKFLLLETADMNLLHPEFREGKGDNYILGVAAKFRDDNPFILTSDVLFSIAAEVERIPTISLKEFYSRIGYVPHTLMKGNDTGEEGKTYMDVYKDIYAKKGNVFLKKFEKECKKAGILASDFGFDTFQEYIESLDVFSIVPAQNGNTYVNLK